MNSPDPAKSAVEQAAMGALNKQETWAKVNRKPLIIGAVVGLLVGFLLFHVL